MPLVGKALTDTADAVADAALAISNCHVQPGSDADKRARAVGAAHASRRHGAPPPVPAEGSAAFLSSAALANVAMIGAPEQFPPFDGTASAALRQEWSQVRAYVGLANPRGRWLITSACAQSCRKPRETPREPPPPSACG